MKLNLKNLLTIGLSAVLASIVLGVNEADGATPNDKDTVRVKYSIKDIKARWAEQEKKLTPEQKTIWKELQRDKRFKNVLPRILDQLDITKIQITKGKSPFIPITSDVFFTYHPGLGDFYLLTAEQSMANNIIPAHEMSDFMTDKLDCFFIPQSGDKALSADEKKTIQILDKCLNEIYAFVYARGTANIDKKTLMNGDYAGMVWDINGTTIPERRADRRTPAEEEEYKKMWETGDFSLFFFYYTNVDDLMEDHPKFTKRYSKEENAFLMYLGYPYSVKDLAEMGSGFVLSGGCSGEMHYQIFPFGGIKGVSWVYKPTNKMAERTLYHYKNWQPGSMRFFCKNTERAFKECLFPQYGIDIKNMKKLTPFQKVIVQRYETANKYNQKILRFVNSVNKVPQSLAHKKFLNRELNDNFNRLHTAQKVETHTAVNTAMTEKNRDVVKR